MLHFNYLVETVDIFGVHQWLRQRTSPRTTILRGYKAMPTASCAEYEMRDKVKNEELFNILVLSTLKGLRGLIPCCM